MAKTTITRTKSCQESSAGSLTVTLKVQRVQNLDDSRIVELPSRLISQMACDERARFIEPTRLPLLRPEVLQGLQKVDRKNPERLAHWARWFCQ